MAEPTDPRAIGIFDSGLGGLTVARAVQDAFPGEAICYLGDTARVPYGTKSPETVLQYAREDIELRMLKEQQVEAHRVIEALDAALAQDGDALLSDAERSPIVVQRDALEAELESAATEDLKRMIRSVEAASEFYVARRMNRSVQQALTGKQIDEVDV